MDLKNQSMAKKPAYMFEEDIKNSGLNRVLTKWGLTSLGIGAIIGTGIFVLTGIAAKMYAGPALAISFIFAGIACGFAAMCYAEFASMLPVEGSAYAYSYATMGELFAWIIGWDLILEYAMGAATVAVGWSGYMVKLLNLFHIKFPLWLMTDYKTGIGKIADATAADAEAAGELAKLGKAIDPNTQTELAKLTSHYSSMNFPSIMGYPFAVNLPAFLVIILVTYILYRGIKEASSTNNGLVILKVAVVLFVIVVGSFYVDIANWSPFVPERMTDVKGVGHYGWAGVLTGASTVFFAYIGFDAVSTQAGEAKNPDKDVPFGIIASLILCTILYILVSLVLTGMVKYDKIDITAPIADAFSRHGLDFAAFIITIAAVAGLTSVLIVLLLGQTRVFYSMAKDGLLPPMFSALHPKYKTPYKATLLTGAVVAVVSAFTPINVIADMVNIGTLLAFVMVCGAVWLMRVREPNKPRPFRTPWLPFVAVGGMLSNFLLMLYLPGINWVRLFVWLLIGFIIYFNYSAKHSKLGQHLKNKAANDI